MIGEARTTHAIALGLVALLWTAPAGAQHDRRSGERPAAEHGGDKPPCTTHHEKDPIPVVYPEPDADCPHWQWIGVLKPADPEEQGREHEGGGPGYGEERPDGTESERGHGGEREDWSCPDAGHGWSVRHLFCPIAEAAPLGPPRHDVRPDRDLAVLPPDCDPATLPPGLRPFCLYRHEDAGAELSVGELPRLAAIARDCAVVGPMAGNRVKSTLVQREAHFLAQAKGLQTEGIEGDPPSAVTRLALLDTSPTTVAGALTASPDDAGPRSMHGRSLRFMAEKLRGGPGAAGVAVGERLAMAYVSFDPASRLLSLRDEVRGGFFGTFGDLAQAIRAEVVAWQMSGEEHLVLNLSLGWQRAHGGLETPVGAMPAPVQAIYRALEDAVCRGALPVAAAGNRTWGPDLDANRGALLPGAWEARGAPGAGACTAAVEPGAVELADGPGYRPLLYAAGGVEADGRPLGNSRADFGGEPRLVAFAEHAVVARADRPGEPTAVLTGSSVAAAIVAAAAAAAWSDDPGLDAFAAIDRVARDNARDGLGRRAGFCLRDEGAACPEVRRVRLAPLPPGARRAVAPLRLDSAGDPDFANVAVLDGRRFHRLPASGNADCPPPEIAGLLRRATGDDPAERWRNAGGDPLAALYRCPRWQLGAVDARPATAPQPDTPGCSSCGFEQNSPGAAYLEIDPAYVGRITAAVLYVGRNAYSLPVDLNRNPRVRIVNLEAEDDDRIFLSVVVDGTRSATSPLLRVNRP